ncbi:hypothetical protein JCM3774_004635 [Rhodotorula dairenensis]
MQSAVRWTSAQLAERAFALQGHGCAAHPASSSSSSSCGKRGTHSACAASSLDHESRRCTHFDDEEEDDPESDGDGDTELVDERFLDPASPLGRAIEVIGRAHNLSSVAARFVSRMDDDLLVRAASFGEHCWNRDYTLQALDGANNIVGTFTALITRDMLDDYLDFYGERPQDAVPFHEVASAPRPPHNPAEPPTPPTPRPGPPRLGRPAAGYTSPSLASDASPGYQAFSLRSRTTSAAVSAAAVRTTTATPRRRRPSRATAVTTEEEGPASMPESARQELYELYQYSSDGSRARRHDASRPDSDAGPLDGEVDSLESGLQELDLEPYRLAAVPRPSALPSRDEEDDEYEVSYEEEIVEEEVVTEEWVEQDLYEQHAQGCEDPEAEAAERERDLLEQRTRQRSGGSVGR